MTRYTNAAGFATVNICATFDYNTSGLWSYVRCSSMTAYQTNKPSNVVCSRWNKSQSNGYIKSGTAFAQVSYSFYNSNIPTNAASETFKITCSDTGTIKG